MIDSQGVGEEVDNLIAAVSTIHRRVGARTSYLRSARKSVPSRLGA